MSSRARAADRAGFALIESIVALAIISTFAVAVLATLGAQIRAADRAATMLTAQALAEDRQMAIELLDQEDLLDLPDSLAAGVFPPPFELYSWTARVERVADEEDLFATEVVVTDGPFSYPLRGMIHRSATIIIAGGAL
jgi:prepilin-type N-terminal cleavage/methylation domain-containing protein